MLPTLETVEDKSNDETIEKVIHIGMSTFISKKNDNDLEVNRGLQDYNNFQPLLSPIAPNHFINELKKIIFE